MKTKKWMIGIAIVLMVGFAAGMAGWIAFKPAENGKAPEEDRMIGVYITRTHLPADKIYAEHTKDITGNAYTFGNTEGAVMLVNYSESGGTPCYESFVSGSIQTEVNIRDTDTGSIVELNGTIYYTKGEDQVVFFPNPVYKSADGKIYVTTGNGISADYDVSSSDSGDRMSTTLTESTQVTTGNVDKTYTIHAQVQYIVMNMPVKISVLQFDADHTCIKEDVYDPRNLPEEYVPDAGTEYLLAETTYRNEAGNDVVEREAFGREKNTAELFCPEEDGTCSRKDVYIRWNVK